MNCWSKSAKFDFDLVKYDYNFEAAANTRVAMGYIQSCGHLNISKTIIMS